MPLFGALGELVREGKVVVTGEIALDASNPTPITTTLKSITAAAVTLKGTAAPGVGTSILTYNINGNTLDVYAWKVTSSAVTTLIASTGTETISYVIVGEPLV